jgi:ATP-dependent exoDNAse (exonuclease V) beta subunit
VEAGRFFRPEAEEPAAEEIDRALAAARAEPPRPWLSAFQGRYYVTEVKRWTDRWRNEEALGDGTRAAWVPEEGSLSWPASLANLLRGEKEDDADTLSSGKAPRLEPREWGQVAHLILEKLDLGDLPREGQIDAGDLTPQIRSILGRHGLPVELAERSAGWIAPFLDSETGRSMLRAWARNPGNVFREASFTLKLSLAELRRILSASGVEAVPGASATEEELEREWTLLQGQIDALYKDGEDWVLLDYKTDAMPPDAALARRARAYIPQMRLYEMAARRLWGTRSLRSRIYFLRAGRVVEIPPEER